MQKKKYLILWSTIGFFIAMALLSISNGPKGSDQYWYLAATESIIQNNAASSNNIFPVIALQGKPIKNPLIHNIPVIYLASLPAFLVGAHLGWFIFNIFIAGIIYLLILYLLIEKFQKELSLYLISLFVIFPFNVMYATQPLSDAFLGFLVTVAVYLYYKRSTFKYFHLVNILISIIISVLAVSRSNYILFIFLIPFLLRRADSIKLKLLSLISYLSSFLVAFLLLKSLLPEIGFQNLKHILLFYSPEDAPPMLGVWGKEPEFLINNKGLNLFPELVKLYWLKLRNAISTQFFSFDLPSLFSNWIFNGLFFLSIIGYFTKRKTNLNIKKYFYVSLFLFSFHFITAVLFVNIIRYLYPLYPIMALNTMIIYSDNISSLFSKSKVIFYTFFALIYLIFFLVGAYNIDSYVNEAKDQKNLRENISNALTTIIPRDETIWTDKQNSLISYTLYPRDFLNTCSTQTDEELITMFKNTDPKWFFCWNHDSDLIERLGKYNYSFAYITQVTYRYKNNDPEQIKVYKMTKRDTGNE